MISFQGRRAQYVQIRHLAIRQFYMHINRYRYIYSGMALESHPDSSLLLKVRIFTRSITAKLGIFIWFWFMANIRIIGSFSQCRCTWCSIILVYLYVFIIWSGTKAGKTNLANFTLKLFPFFMVLVENMEINTKIKFLALLEPK